MFAMIVCESPEKNGTQNKTKMRRQLPVSSILRIALNDGDKLPAKNGVCSRVRENLKFPQM